MTTTQPDLTQADADMALADFMATCVNDPLRHVMASYPWGEAGTPLEDWSGPDPWQRDFLIELGEAVKKNAFNGYTPCPPVQMSTSSGHGIGKSCLSGWLIIWLRDTRPQSMGVVTANTAEQLRSKTFQELSRWHDMSLTKHWFQLNAGSAGSLNMYHKHDKTWGCSGQTCQENNSEAFAGQHRANSTSYYLFDEAGGIPSPIFDVRAGGLTDGEPMTFDFGNPTRNSGRFYENMMGKFKHRYIKRFIDSRSVAITNKELFKEWEQDFGEDSDFFKVRVRGIFASSSDMQFIPRNDVDKGINLEVHVTPADPLVMGVDVARFGDDQSVIYLRQGRDAESQGLHIYRSVDTMTLASEVARIAADKNPDTIFIDGGGVGGGVVDRCRQLSLDVVEINFGSKATQNGYANMRSQMWGNMRDALKDGVRLPENDDLISDLTGLEYGYNLRNDIQLESKKDAKKRGIASPDIADALALTYCLPVAPTRQGYDGAQFGGTTSDYEPL